jgi:ubiquinone/menaquinone biosynthesis C-methylase UbiE
MDTDGRYYGKIAAAFVRGKAKSEKLIELPVELLDMDVYQLSEDEINDVVQRGADSGLRLHKFKRTMELPRVRKVLGFIRGQYPQSLLDVGSGRGNFLWPLMDSFPYLNVTSIDIDIRRVNDINAVREGGFDSLSVQLMDATKIGFENEAFDMVTALEVLEHIPDWKQALSEIVRVASNYVIVSVPSKEDDNPEHIHLFNMDMLQNELKNSCVRKISFEYVLNHIIVIARK